MQAFHKSLILPVGLALLGAALGLWLIPREIEQVQQLLLDFPDADQFSHQLRPWVIAGMCALLPIAGIAYRLGSLLDRYLVRLFLVSFGICTAALMVIWLLIDLSDNFPDLRQSEQVVPTMLEFYSSRLPGVLMLLLPHAILLAALSTLNRLSTLREVTAMIQAGRSIWKVGLPVLICGLGFALFLLGLNYQWAPAAESRVKSMLDVATGKPAFEAKNVLFRNPHESRLWMVGAFPENFQHGEPLLDVEITTTRADHSIETRLLAPSAKWDRARRTWQFEKPLLGSFENGMPARYQPIEGNVIEKSWSETPWQLIKPGLSAREMGIPELNTWLENQNSMKHSAAAAPYLTHWHYRWSQPVTCVVMVLLAIPLAVHFSRRATSGNTVLAIILSAILMLLGNISLSLGESGLVAPILAAWLPNVIFILLAAGFFYLRLTGRPLYAILRSLVPVT